ncbi:hypothetical protein BGX38DRAFT_1277122 [Terfezia claveryi]|nr:hypothetical protein BGX38DRAFT_1277122 [Terfezia claveryi]
MAIKGAREHHSSTKDRNLRNAKRVAHGRPTSPGLPRPALSAPGTDSTGSESEQPDSQGFYDTIIVHLPAVPFEPEPATASQRVSTPSGKPVAGKRKRRAVPKSSHSSSALPVTCTTHGRPAAKKVKVSRDYTRTGTSTNRNRRPNISCCIRAAQTHVQSYNFGVFSVAPVVDGGHVDISSPPSSYQSAFSPNLLHSISTRDGTTRSIQQSPMVLFPPLSWVQDIASPGLRLSTPYTNVYPLSVPRRNGLIVNTRLTRLSQQHASAPQASRSFRLSLVQEVSPPPAHYPPTSGPPKQIVPAAATDPPPLPLFHGLSSPMSMGMASSLRGLPGATKFPASGRNIARIAFSGFAAAGIYADEETQILSNDERCAEVGSDGAPDVDTSSSCSEDETKPHILEPEIDTEAMLKRLAVRNPALAKLLSSGSKSGRQPQRRNGFVQDITGRMKKITEGSKYSWPEEKMPLKVNLVNRLTRKTKRTMEDEEGRRVPGFFHSVSFEEKWEVSGERDNFDMQSVKQLRGHGFGKRTTDSVGNLEDSPMGRCGDSTDEVLDTIIARMSSPELPPTLRTANGTPASPRLTTPALSINTSQASSIQGVPSPIVASPISNWSKVFYMPDDNLGELAGEQITKDYPLLKGVDTDTQEVVGAACKKGECKAQITEWDDTLLDGSEARAAARVLHSLRF